MRTEMVWPVLTNGACLKQELPCVRVIIKKNKKAAKSLQVNYINILIM